MRFVAIPAILVIRRGLSEPGVHAGQYIQREKHMTKPPLGERVFRTWMRVELIYIAVIVVVGALIWLIF